MQAKNSKELETNRLGIAIDWQADNQIRAARRQRFSVPYELNEAEFERVVLPAIAHLDAVPSAKSITLSGKQCGPLLWQCCSKSWASIGPARDLLLGTCDIDDVPPCVSSVADNYKKLKVCEREGVQSVRLLAGRKCQSCKIHDGKTMGVMELLAMFSNGHYALAHQTWYNDDELISCPGPLLAEKSDF
jgi:hypothetical protein